MMIHSACDSANPLHSHLKNNPPWVAKKGANTNDSTAMSLIKMLSDGPDVSLRGSPIVSPITAALCGSEPFGPSNRACSEAPACGKNLKDQREVQFQE